MTSSATEQDLRAGPGRTATRPSQIPVRGWRDILMRTKNDLAKNNVSIVAAGVAFYALLSIFPALAAIVSIYGLAADPADVQETFDTLAGVLPTEARTVLSQQLHEIVTGSETTLGIGLAVAVGLALWSASGAIRALMSALTIVYGEEERRGFFKFNGIALLLTFGGILLTVASIGLVVAVPAIFAALGIENTLVILASQLRWPVLAAVVMVALAIIYRHGPSRSTAKWRWVSYGAVAATLIWLICSIAFSYYVANFGQYNETYGSVGALVILLLWFYLSAYIVLLGATVNAEMEHQTAEDSTAGRPRPMGSRGAFVADTLGNHT